MTIQETIDREAVADANRNALVAVLNETGAILPASSFNAWRPVLRTQGVIHGMPVRVTCVATDGNLGLFIPCCADGHGLGTAFLGHVHRFCHSDGSYGSPGPLFSYANGGKAGAKLKRLPNGKKTRKQLLAEI